MNYVFVDEGLKILLPIQDSGAQLHPYRRLAKQSPSAHRGDAQFEPLRGFTLVEQLTWKAHDAIITSES
jgi:hypothetical protein